MKGSSWLQDHLNEFVKPYLGFIPEYVGAVHFTNQEKTIIKNVWRSVKRQLEGRQLVLAGRDVFVWEVLARREKFPTIFLPQCSRESVEHVILPKGNLYLFDTGFLGSIPKALKLERFSLLSYAGNERDISKQTFPRLTGSRGLALKVEYTPKYWQTGRLVDGKVIQNLAKEEEFAKAVQLTYEIYCDSSAKFTELVPGKRRYSWKTSSLNLW